MVTFEAAKILKEIGYSGANAHLGCPYYDHSGYVRLCEPEMIEYYFECYALTYADVFDWLMSMGMFPVIFPNQGSGFGAELGGHDKRLYASAEGKDWVDAASKILNEALKILKK